MKLRIDSGAIRLRLKQGEVRHFAETGLLEQVLPLGPGPAFAYALKADAHAEALAVTYDGRRLTVLVPAAMVKGWADGEQVGLEGSCAGVTLLVEKDFQCLHREGTPADADAFPHPGTR
jgi:hypothetical protein